MAVAVTGRIDRLNPRRTSITYVEGDYFHRVYLDGAHVKRRLPLVQRLWRRLRRR